MTQQQKKTIRDFKARTYFDRWFHATFERAWADVMTARGAK